MIKQVKFLAGIYAANSYVVFDDNSKDAIIIDLGGDHKDIEDYLTNNKLNLKTLLLTHGHADHIAGVPFLKKDTNVDVYIHESDVELVEDASKNFSDSMAMGPIEFSPDYTFRDGDILNFGTIKVKVLSTPGHTKGSVLFITDVGAFTGDTLFRQSIGRSDLYGGNEAEIMNSLRNIVMSLPDDMECFPGHGPKTSIGYERNHNMFLK